MGIANSKVSTVSTDLSKVSVDLVNGTGRNSVDRLSRVPMAGDKVIDCDKAGGDHDTHLC